MLTAKFNEKYPGNMLKIDQKKKRIIKNNNKATCVLIIINNYLGISGPPHL